MCMHVCTCVCVLVLEHFYLVFGANCFYEEKHISLLQRLVNKLLFCGDYNFKRTFAVIFFSLLIKQWTREILKFDMEWNQPLAVPNPNPNNCQPINQFIN